MVCLHARGGSGQTWCVCMLDVGVVRHGGFACWMWEWSDMVGLQIYGPKLCSFRGGASLFFPFFSIKKNNSYKCCCKHLLAISYVVETLEHPFQSFGAFCPCNFTSRLKFVAP